MVTYLRRGPLVGALAVLVLAGLSGGRAQATTAGLRSWQSGPARTATQQYLNGVSCTSAHACVAVGDSATSAASYKMVAVSWNGTTWRTLVTASPKGASISALYGVSCRSSSMCLAVGDYAKRSGTFALAEAWNGKAWRVLATPQPIGATESELSAVACTKANACIAVGSYSKHSRVDALAERWNGKSWTVTPAVNSASPYNYLDGVACKSRTTCVAVGSYLNGAGQGAFLAETWDGRAWRLRSPARPAGSDESMLAAVACSSTGCMSSGSVCLPLCPANLGVAGGQPVAEHWNGRSWAAESALPPGGAKSGGALRSVSCTTARSCMAVGAYHFTPRTLAEVWNGSRWADRPSPNPGGATASYLNGISCTSSRACLAVGDSCAGNACVYAGGTYIYSALAETWNGSRWMVTNHGL